MNKDQIDFVLKNPKYQELIKKRSKFVWILSTAMLVVYYAFILVVAFKPSLFAAKIGDGITTVGIPVGVGIIIFAFILTGIYVRRANGEFDALSNSVVEDLKKQIGV